VSFGRARNVGKRLEKRYPKTKPERAVSLIWIGKEEVIAEMPEKFCRVPQRDSRKREANGVIHPERGLALCAREFLPSEKGKYIYFPRGKKRRYEVSDLKGGRREKRLDEGRLRKDKSLVMSRECGRVHHRTVSTHGAHRMRYARKGNGTLEMRDQAKDRGKLFAGTY